MSVQQAAPLAGDGRVVLALRVGVTGHRKFDNVDPAALETAVDRVLGDVETMVNEVAAGPVARNLYRDDKPVLCLISPLAEGADRLVARLAAVKRKWRLIAPLPFAQAEYENDFPRSVREFCELLAVAEQPGQPGGIIELDGYRSAEKAAYLQVGRFVLRHSDVVIAIWNGKPASGEGGTGQIVAEARERGIPVVHIDPAAPRAVRLLAGDAAPRPYHACKLGAILQPLLLPDWHSSRRDHAGAAHDHVRAACEYLRQERVRATATPPDFLHRGPFRAPASRLGRFFPWFLRKIKKLPPPPAVDAAAPPAGPDNPVVRTFYLHFRRADVLAAHYADLHRSGFALIYLFGSLALVCAFTSLLLHTEEPIGGIIATSIEFLCLSAIFGLVVAERRQRWRERWLDYRLLAELLRQSDLLAQIGGVPVTGACDPIDDMHPERGWVFWLAAAIVRSIGVVGRRYDRVYLEQVRDYAAQVRLADQIAYHERTSNRHAAVSRRLRRFSEVLFGLAVAAVVAEFAEFVRLEAPGALPASVAKLAEFVRLDAWGAWPAWLAGVFPAVGAAGFGIRNQAEFEIVMHRSARLRRRLTWEKDRISRLRDDALSSATLAAAIERGARLMQSDAAEWEAIFEVKESEVV